MHKTEIISIEDLQELMIGTHSPAVSIYFPTESLGRDRLKAPINLKNRIVQAEERMKEMGLRWDKIESVLFRAKEMISDFGFWQHQSEGIAIYMATGFFRCYHLPVKPNEQVVVQDRFDIKPLLPLLTNDGLFYVLAISENSARLYEGTRYSIREVEVPDMPRSMDEALWADQPEKQIQFHTGAGRSPEGGGRTAMYFGTGDTTDMEQHKVDLKRYFDLVDRPLRDLLVKRPAPLLIAAVDYLQPIYKQANSYNGLYDEGLMGNFDRATAPEIHEKAVAIIEPHLRAHERRACDLFFDAQSVGKASFVPEDVVKAAFYGRVENLFIAAHEVLPGRFDEATGEVHVDGGEDLINLAASATLMSSGTVFTLPKDEMPGGSPIAAIFRY